MRSFLIFVFAIVFLAEFSLAASRAPAGEALDAVVSKAYDLYIKKKYDEALELLEPYKTSADQNPKWYYISGLCLLRTGRYDEAELTFDTFVKKIESGSASAAKGYYFLGLSSFYKGEYQKALNTFQVSQDVSRDTNLDRILDIQIDKSVRFRDYYDTHKPGSFALFIGYEAHKNVLGLSPDSVVDKSLNGHVFSYGVSLGYRPVDRINFIFEPSVAVLDRYTMDRSFKADSTLQALDLLQAVVSLPIVFYIGNNSGTQYNFSLNGYSIYLPINSTNRELYLSSVFVRGRILFDVNQKLSMDISLIGASDKGYNFSSEDDDATGTRTELAIAAKHFLDKERTQILTYGLGASIKNSIGVNTRYQKGRLSIGYQFSGPWENITSGADLAYEYLNYPDKATPRKDNKGIIEYSIVQMLNPSSSLSYRLGTESNSSDVDLYKYDDIYAGLQYTLAVGF